MTKFKSQSQLEPCPKCGEAVAVKTFNLDTTDRQIIIIHAVKSICDGIDPGYRDNVASKPNNDADRQALADRWNADQSKRR